MINNNIIHIVMESRAGDYIRKHHLTKDDALKPENIKKIRAAMDPAHPTKTSVQNAKKAIEAVFNNKERNISTTTDAREQAKRNPIKGYSLSKKMYFVHVGAKKKAEDAIKKYLQSAKAGEINVKITNTAVNNEDQSFDISLDTYVIGIHVILSKTSITGIRKFLAVLKESSCINENIFDGLMHIFGYTTANAKKNIDAANNKLKELIGVLAIKAYITYFIGKRIGEQIDASNIFSGVNMDGEMKGRISYYIAVKQN